MKHLPTKKTALTVLAKLLSPSDLKLLKNQIQVVLMVGMPGSGKSTISDMLSAVFGYWRFSSDQIRQEELFPDQEHRWAKAHQQVMQARLLVYQELARRICVAVERGQRVVVDCTNLDDNRNTIMTSLLQICPPNKIAFLMLKTPEKIIRQRFLRDQDGPDKWWSVYQHWKNYLQSHQVHFPRAQEYPGVNLLTVKRYDLETYDWTINIGAIVWDIDGTLYHAPALSKLFYRQIIALISQHLDLPLKQAEQKFQEIHQQLASTTLTLDKIGLDGRKVINDLSLRLDYSHYLKLDPKLKSLITSLNQFHHIILSNSHEQMTRRKLKALGLSPRLFSAIYSTYDLPYLKPDRRIFEHVIKQTSFAPYQHLMVGNQLGTDILPAKAAGMMTALVWGHSHEADASFDHIYDVGRLFGVEI